MEDWVMKSLTTILLIIIHFICLMFLNSCISDEPFKFEGTTIPQQMNDGWQVASPEDVNINQAALDEVYNNFVSEDRFLNSKSLLVVKNNKLVFEAYCRSADDRDRYGHVMSVTKSITSLAFGIVKSEGFIDSLGQRLYDIMPEKFPSDVQKRSITLQHLLTMRSGLSFDNDVFSVEIFADKPGDPIKYILEKPMYAAPGEKYYYRDCDPHLISYTIGRLTGKTLEQWTQEHLFDPLGISDYYWVQDNTGTTAGAFGLWLKPRDMAKIGQMVLDHGLWEDIQIVDSGWVAISTQKQVETENNTEPYIYHYGYYWWIIPRWNAISAFGTGGNVIFIMPGKEMVIVMTSMPDVNGDLFNQNLQSFEELILPLLE
jgi:CubicO group peptidase (beta-lactamase class C family)